MNLFKNGRIDGLYTPIVGKVIDVLQDNEKEETIQVVSDYEENIVALITNSKISKNFTLPVLTEVKNNFDIEVGDVVSIEPSGLLSILYRNNSSSNTILFTEKCNHNCIMCSQPPLKMEDFQTRFFINKELVKFIPKDSHSIGITGGEPFLYKNEMIEYIELLSNELPNTEIHILTNGTIFENRNLVDKLSEIDNNNICLGIPLYSENHYLHDLTVDRKGAFYKTIDGLYNLARNGIRIEIRNVITKLNYKSLEKYARFLFKNLPFVEHIAFMGLETIGNAKEHLYELWIHPEEFITELEFSLVYLNSLNLNASIYNLPYCFIPDSIKPNYCKSISDWKNIFLDNCKDCEDKNNCGGFFQSIKNLTNFNQLIGKN